MGLTVTSAARRAIGGIAVVTLFAAASAPVSGHRVSTGGVAPILWSTVDLGTLGGESSSAEAINDRGQVVGASSTAKGDDHAFLWANGRMRDLGTLGRGNSIAYDINEKGLVVGTSDVAGGRHAVLWRDDQIRDLGTLGGTKSDAVAVNDRGQIIGNSLTPTGEWRAFIWEKWKMTEIFPAPADRYSGAEAINERGQVVGWINRRSLPPRIVLWAKGRATTLSRESDAYAGGINDQGIVVGGPYVWQRAQTTTLPTLGGLHTGAVAVNDGGAVIGWSGTRPKEERKHGFLWKAGTMIDLGTLGGTQSDARAISRGGTVVGYSDVPSEPRQGTTFHAFAWRERVLVDLGTLGGANSGADAINDRDQIVGWADRPVGWPHAVLWTPRRR